MSTLNRLSCLEESRQWTQGAHQICWSERRHHVFSSSTTSTFAFHPGWERPEPSRPWRLSRLDSSGWRRLAFQTCPEISGQLQSIVWQNWGGQGCPTPWPQCLWLNLLHAFSFFKKRWFVCLFLAVLGLHCCAGLSSSCSDQGPLSSCSDGLLVAVTSLAQSMGSRVRGLPQLRPPGSSAQVKESWLMGLVALRHVGSSWIRTESMSPALSGRFFTTEPPGKHCSMSSRMLPAPILFNSKCYSGSVFHSHPCLPLPGTLVLFLGGLSPKFPTLVMRSDCGPSVTAPCSPW